MLASKIITRRQADSKFGLKFDAIFDKFSEYYQRFMRGVLRSKSRSLGIIGSYRVNAARQFIGPRAGFELMPRWIRELHSVSGGNCRQGYSMEENSHKVMQTIIR
jgi:multidrug efflux pump subunit AcrB